MIIIVISRFARNKTYKPSPHWYVNLCFVYINNTIRRSACHPYVIAYWVGKVNLQMKYIGLSYSQTYQKYHVMISYVGDSRFLLNTNEFMLG